MTDQNDEEDRRNNKPSLPPLTASVTLRQRMNFSVQHLLLAARLAREVDTVETANAGAEFGAFFDVVLGSSVGCVVLSVASLESYVNEIFADRAVHFTAIDQQLVDLLWAEYERKEVLDKFQLALRLRTGALLDRGGPRTQAVDRLIRLRNALVHFRPEWLDELVEHEKLSQKLEGYVSRSPWLLNEALFPRAWATHLTTSWVVSTVIEFIAGFSTESGIPDRIAMFRSRLSTVVV